MVAARVYVSVMNSRSAAKEMKQEEQRSRRPAEQEGDADHRTITHHALMRALRLSIDAVRLALGDREASATQPTIDATSRITPTPANSEMGLLLRRHPRWAARGREQRGAGALDERVLRASPAASVIGAPKLSVHSSGTGSSSPLGSTRRDVLDPDRHELDVGASRGEVVEAALERQQRARRSCCACLRERRSASSPCSTTAAICAIGSCVRVVGSRSIRTARNTRSATNGAARPCASSRRPRPARVRSRRSPAGTPRSARSRRGWRDWRNRRAGAAAGAHPSQECGRRSAPW